MCRRYYYPFCVLLFANVQADDTQRINVRMNNISLSDFFSYIEKNYSYTFMYDNTDINDKQLISVNERNQPIEKCWLLF